MDGGGRGFFPSSQPGAPGATRARPVSANTRLRQKPAAANQDFFASLGIDAQTSRGRTGSSASSSSNRSFNSVTMRSGPSPAPVPVSAGPPPQIGGWRPPPIGGLGSSRRTSSVSSMTSTTSSTTGLRTFADRSVALSTTVTSSNAAGGLTTESTIATTSNTVAAATTAIGAVSAPPKAEAAEKKKPTQLFSMEDADELYSDDGWNCDSPLAVLSNPMDKAGSAAAMDQVEATSEQKDEFAWGEDDEALVSPVAEPAAPPQVPQSDFTPSGKDRAPFATTAPPVNAFGTQVGTAPPPPPPAEFAWADDDDAFASSGAKTAAPIQPDAALSAYEATTVHISATSEFEMDAASPPPAEFAWADDDDAFASPVAKSMVPAQPPQSDVAAKHAAFAIPTEAAATFENKVDATLPPPAEFAWADDDDTFASPVANSVTSEQPQLQGVTPGASELATTASNTPIATSAFASNILSAPPASTSTMRSSSFSTLTQSSAFETKTANAPQTRPESAPLTQSYSTGETRQPIQQSWGGHWDQSVADVGGSTAGMKISNRSVPANAVTGSAMAAIPTGTLGAPAVALTSPGGAAGEFWADGDDEALFDHDEHADEDWDETIREPGASMSLNTGGISHAGSSLSGQVSSPALSSPSCPPPAPVRENKSLPTPEEYDTSVSTYSEQIRSSGQDDLTSDSFAVSQTASTTTGVQAQSLGSQESAKLHSAQCGQEAKPAPAFDTENAPFSSAIAASNPHGDDPNVYPEASPSVRFLHTPTGTGGPFGRVPSPRDEKSSFHDETSRDPVLEHDAHQPSNESVSAEGTERLEESQASESYAESSVKWDMGSMQQNNHDQGSSEVRTRQADDEAHHDIHQGQSDEEERDSVVSFSGSNSFYPSTGRPSSLYGGSQSSFTSHRMYQSSIASTDHEGSSIASFGVSSAGATFGGSERVSEGGAFSDGTVSETPSMVDSSNASTAFGTDFPSVSEGQFSAPGTTIGGSENASDGGFSDGNASETTSMCESVSTNPRFVSEFSSSTGHYVTENVEHRNMQEPFATSTTTSDSAEAFSSSAPSTLFGVDDSSADSNPFASGPSAFPTAQIGDSALPTDASTDADINQSSSAPKSDHIPTAASLFGATAGTDVPNPFSSFGTPAAAHPADGAPPIEEHELPTSDAGDLFGSGPPSDFNSSFERPAHNAYDSSYQTQHQTYSHAIHSHVDNSTGRAPTINSAQSQFNSARHFDQQASDSSTTGPFEAYSSSNYNNAGPFSAHSGDQRGFGGQTTADSVFGRGDYTRGSSSQIDGSDKPSADAMFGVHGRTDNTISATSGQFGQQSTVQGYNTSYGDQNYNQYDQASRQAAVNAFGGKNHDHFGQGGSVGRGATMTRASDHFSRHSSASSLVSNPAQRETSGYAGQSRYGSGQYGQSSVPGTPDNYSRQAAADAFARGSPARQPFGSEQNGNYDQHGQNTSHGGFGSHTRSSSNASADAFFARSATPTAIGAGSQFGSDVAGGHTQSSSSASADVFFGRSTSDTGSVSAASHFSEAHALPPTVEPVNHQAPAQNHSQPSFSRSESNTSSYSAQYDARPSSMTPTRSSQGFSQAHDLNTSSGSIEGTSFSRHASSSSMNQYVSDAPSQLQRTQQQQYHDGSTAPPPAADANTFFGRSPAPTSESTSSFFGGASSQDHTAQSLELHKLGAPDEAPQFPSGQQRVEGASNHYEYGNNHVDASAQLSQGETEPKTDVDPAINLSDQPNHATPDEFSSVSNDATATTSIVDARVEAASQFTTDVDTNRPQAFSGFDESTSASQGISGQTSSDFFSSGQVPQANLSAPHQFDHGEYGSEVQDSYQQQVRGGTNAPHQYADARSAFHQPNTAPYENASAHATATNVGSYFNANAQGANASAGLAPYPQQQYHQHDGYDYHGETVQTQPQTTGYQASTQSAYGTSTLTGFEYGATTTGQKSYPAAAPVVKTSNKYKDPCVAPPSCLASFGFGGNVVTMFPKRKVVLNSGFRNSPRGAPVPSHFNSTGRGELRKGPVKLYRMDQLHPSNKEFEQMDIFPGPLAEDVSDETILEYIDDRLKRSETPTSANEAEDENERLLLGVLRVIVKCNGKLRSDPGISNPTDPTAPEAQLVAVLSESSQRRNGNQSAVFPAPRKVQSATHPDLAVKHANELRQQLLIGDRKGAVSTAMNAHMWPEAMLIASFTDKDEYRRVLRMYLDEHYATGDPSRALFMAFADQQDKSVQEPKRLLQTHDQSAASLILSSWVSHAQILIANRTADTNKILTELGDRLWNEESSVAAAHVCYLLAGIQVEAPMPSSKIALLGGDHRTPKEARFYVSPAAVQRTEVYEWAQKHSRGASGNLMIPFQGYKLIYAMLLADHGKLETAFKYVTSMLAVIKAVTATMKPGTSMYLEGMKNQLTVLDDRLRQHLGQDRVASVAASTSRGGGRKQGGKWGLGNALSIMGKIVNRVVEGNDSNAAAPSESSATTSGGLYASEAAPPAASYPNAPSVTAPSPSPTPSYLQHQVQQTPPPSSHGPSSHGPSPVPSSSYGHATPPVSQGSAPGSSNGYNRASPASAAAFARPGISSVPSSGPFSGSGRPGVLRQQSSGPFSGNGKVGYSTNGPMPQGHKPAPSLHTQHSMEPPGSNHSNRSASSGNMPSIPTNNGSFYSQQQQQPPSSQTSQLSQHSQDTQPARAAPPTFQQPSSDNDVRSSAEMSSQPKSTGHEMPTEAVDTHSPTPVDAAMNSGPASDKGTSGPKKKKSAGRSKTPPPSNSSKGSGWLSGLSSFIATKMNPEAKVAKLGEQMDAYFDEETKRWVFPGEAASEEPTMPTAPPKGPLPGSAPGSMATGAPPIGTTNSAPGSISSGAPSSNDPLAALMAPPPSHMLMKKDPLAAMMAPPARAMGYGPQRSGSAGPRKPPRPQFAVFKPSAASAPDQTEQSAPDQ